MRKIAMAAIAIGAVSLGACAIAAWIRARDASYDDDAEIQRHAASPPRELVVPDDVTLTSVPSASPINPALLDVSLGKRSTRVHGRVAESGEVGTMVDWGKKLNVAVGAEPGEANLLIDEAASYHDVATLLYTLGQHELTRFHFVVRTGAGLGVVTFRPPAVDGRPLPHALCIFADSVELVSTGTDAGRPLGCGWKGTTFDLAAYRKCFEQVEGYALDPPRPDAPTQAVVVRAGPIPFGRLLAFHVALSDLGLTPTSGPACPTF